jgi:hypothetical protein
MVSQAILQAGAEGRAICRVFHTDVEAAGRLEGRIEVNTSITSPRAGAETLRERKLCLALEAGRIVQTQVA